MPMKMKGQSVIGVSITGDCGVGKSTVAEIIVAALRSKGVKVDLSDDSPCDVGHLDMRAKAIACRGTKVVVKTVKVRSNG